MVGEIIEITSVHPGEIFGIRSRGRATTDLRPQLNPVACACAAENADKSRRILRQHDLPIVDRAVARAPLTIQPASRHQTSTGLGSRHLAFNRLWEILMENTVQSPAVTSEAIAPELGLLDLTVRLSTREITAGKEFAVFVLVKNPFSRPVWIERVHVSLPSELFLAHDVDHAADVAAFEEKEKQDERETIDRQKKLQGKIDELQQSLDAFSERKSGANDATSLAKLEGPIKALTKELREGLRGPSIELVGASVNTLRVESAAPKLGIFGHQDRPATINKLEIVDPRTLYRQRMAPERRVTLKSSLPANAPLYPSSTAVYTVLLDVRRSFIFPPSNYLLQFSANFSFCPASTDDLTKANPLLTNTVAYEISIRPSIYSLIGGAMIGGVTGAMARLLKASAGLHFDTLSWPVIGTSGFAVVLAAILSAIAIIFVARKSDAQSFISVEDFWGGLLTGFFVGYTGTEFFGELTKLGGQSAPPPP
jgi:hypothetical protein